MSNVTQTLPLISPAARVRKLRPAASLLEVTFVLLVIIGIIAGVLSMATNTMRQSDVTQETQTLTNLAAAAMKVKSPSGFDGDEILPSIGAMGMIPANVTNTGTAAAPVLLNSWNGSITFDDDDGGGAFTITYTNIPKEECTQLVMAVKQGILKSVGNGATATLNLGSGGTAAQVTAASAATTVCPSTSGNTVTWSSAVK